MVRASLRAQGSQTLAFVSGKSRRLDIAYVSGYAVEASHSPEKQGNPALTAVRGTGLTNTKSSTTVLVEAGHASLQGTSMGWAVSFCVKSQIPFFLHRRGLSLRLNNNSIY